MSIKAFIKKAFEFVKSKFWETAIIAFLLPLILFHLTQKNESGKINDQEYLDDLLKFLDKALHFQISIIHILLFGSALVVIYFLTKIFFPKKALIEMDYKVGKPSVTGILSDYEFVGVYNYFNVGWPIYKVHDDFRREEWFHSDYPICIKCYTKLEVKDDRFYCIKCKKYYSVDKDIKSHPRSKIEKLFDSDVLHQEHLDKRIDKESVNDKNNN